MQHGGAGETFAVQHELKVTVFVGGTAVLVKGGAAFCAPSSPTTFISNSEFSWKELKGGRFLHVVAAGLKKKLCSTGRWVSAV